MNTKRAYMLKNTKLQTNNYKKLTRDKQKNRKENIN